MVDLETAGQIPGSVILSIGAVAFDPETGEIDDGFYSVVNRVSCICAGLRYDQDTIDWWMKQAPEARAVLTESNRDDAPSLLVALAAFNGYLARFAGEEARVWGNGSDFDNALLASAYRAVGIKPGWKFWNSRCYRTLKNLHPDVPLEKRTGVFHNALDDARTQAEHALQIFAKMRTATRFEIRADAEPVLTAVAALSTVASAAAEDDDIIG